MTTSPNPFTRHLARRPTSPIARRSYSSAVSLSLLPSRSLLRVRADIGGADKRLSQLDTSSWSLSIEYATSQKLSIAPIPQIGQRGQRVIPAATATMAAATIPANFEVIMAVVAASFFVHHFFMGFAVGKARKTYGVKYPDLYASKDNCPKEEDAKTFNCVQRGHQNSLELQPIFLSLLVCAGLKHPITSAVIGTMFLAARVLYFTGYSTGVPANRGKGGIGGFLCLFALIGVIIKSVVVWGLALAA